SCAHRCLLFQVRKTREVERFNLHSGYRGSQRQSSLHFCRVNAFTSETGADAFRSCMASGMVHSQILMTAPERSRSSRQRYRAFVDNYKRRKLDEQIDGGGEHKPAAGTKKPKQREYLREYLRWLRPH